MVTPAMRNGTAIHSRLEAELGDVVEVPVTSSEDRLAVRLLQTAAALQLVQRGGVARELYVVGLLQVC